MKKNILAGLALAGMLGAVPSLQAAESFQSDIALNKKISQILQDNPELIMDVLRKHSEEVLEIAQMGSNLRRKHNLELQWKKDLTEKKEVRIEGRPVLGNRNAPVRIVAFSDFTCHYCMQASQTIKDIMRKYGDKVSYVFKHLPMDEKGVGGKASEYFIAIAQQDEAKAWQFYDELYANRDRLLAGGEDYLKKTCKDMGLDMKSLQKDLQGKKVREIMKEDEEDAKKLGVEGTPYFLVNNLIVRGAMPKDLFDGAIDTALKNRSADSGGK